MTDTPVALDASGRLRAGIAIDQTTADAVAAAVCDVVRELLGLEAEPVSASVLGQGPRGFAMVMLRDVSAGGFLSGTASAEDHADAVVEAVLTALGLANGVLAAVVERWKTLGGIRNVSVVENAGQNPAAGTEAHLVHAMPAPGRLAVATQDAEYRVLRFPATAVVVQAAPRAPVLEEVDASMAKVEALGP